MTDKTLQAKLDEFVRLGNLLDAEAKRRYGADGFLFHEADGWLHIMDGDDNRTGDRQSHIQFSASVPVRWGAGTW